MVSTFIRLVQSLSLQNAARLGRAMGHGLWALDIAHRRVAMKNIGIAFPEKSLGEHRRIGKESFLRIAEGAVLTAWEASREDPELEKLYRLTGVQENLLPALAKKKGVVDVMFHMNHWELLSRIVGKIPEARFSTLYQPLRNPRFEALMRQWRGRSGVSLINRHDGFQEAIRRLRNSEVSGVLVDQHAGDHGMWIPFFGRLASTTTLPSLLSRRTGAAIIPIFCHDRRKPDGTPFWEIEFARPVETAGRDDAKIMEELHDRLEAAIRQDPACWFWLHDRWKTPSPNFLLEQYRRGVHVSPGKSLKPFRILIRTPNWLGDAIMALPAIRAIHDGRPDAHITLLTHPKLAGLWKGQSYVDAVTTNWKELKGKDFDSAILLPNSFRSAWEAWRLGIPRRQGYAGHWRRWLLTAICPESFRGTAGTHDSEGFMGLARWSGAKVGEPIPRLDIPAVPRGDYVVLHPGAAYSGAKRWLPERFVELVKGMKDVKWRLIGSMEEKSIHEQLAREMGDHVENWTGRTQLDKLTPMLAGARAMVCNDSGPMHLAAAVGTPVVAIFGSTDPNLTGPLGPHHQVIRHPVPCSPCFLRECPIELPCMKGVTVEEVREKLKSVLSKPRSP